MPKKVITADVLLEDGMFFTIQSEVRRIAQTLKTDASVDDVLILIASGKVAHKLSVKAFQVVLAVLKHGN